MSAQESNVHTLTGSDAIDAIDAQHREKALLERIDRVLGPGFCALADYLRTGEPDRGDPYREIIDHATALAEVLSHVDPVNSEITDNAVPRTANLLWSLLRMGQVAGQLETQHEIVKHQARMAAENGQEGGTDE